MDRKGMVNVIKEILDCCHEITSANVMIMPKDSDTATAKGEQLHIITSIDEPTKKHLEKIIKKYHLALKAEEHKLIIYEPTA